MYCNQCGRQLINKANFCPQCGTRANKVTETKNPTQNQQIINNNRIKQLNKRLQNLEKLGINDPKFSNRAITAWRYFFFTNAIICLTFSTVTILITAIFSQ